MGRPGGATAIERLFHWGTVVGDDDARLLERFRDRRDEAAFAALVDRHGPMVLGVHRRALRDDRDVEDAFQATFLVLARRAGTIRDAGRVGPWLHGVARKVAARARADSARRFVREGARLQTDPAARASPCRDAERRESKAVVDDELARLPARFREPVVLCLLEGLTHDQAADRLGLPVGTVRSRLARARAKLRDRLERRGLSAADALAPLPLPPALAAAALRSWPASVSGFAPASTPAAAGAVALADGVLRTMLLSKAKLAAVALGTVLAVGGTGGFAFQQAAPEPTDAPPQALPAPAKKAASETDPVEDERAARSFREYITQLEADLSLKRLQAQFLDSELKRMEEGLKIVREKLESVEARLAGAPLAKTGPAADVPEVVPAADGRGASPRFLNVATENGRFLLGFGVKDGEVRSLMLAPDESVDLRMDRLIGHGSAYVHLQGPQRDRLAVISPTDGRWHERELVEPADEVTPGLGAGVAAFRAGRRVYAFSTLVNRWAVLEMSGDPSPEDPFVFTDHRVVCFDGRKAHSFDGATGTWTTTETESPKPAP